MTKQIKISARQKSPFVKNLLIIEGIARSGKFLLANVLSGFRDVEPIQYSTLLEQIPFLQSFGLIEKNTAKELLRCEIDNRAYETLIGRNLNHRIFDKSSIFNVPAYKSLIQRSNTEDQQSLIKDFINKKIYSPFILHESLSNMEIYFETFHQLKCISVQRNPIDLVYSWYKRGLGKRWGNDPLLFQIPLGKSKNNTSPWFALDWEELYRNSSEIDRAILSIKALKEKAQNSYNNFPLIIKKKILKIDFEAILDNPNQELERIGAFIGKEQVPQMKMILKRESLPVKAIEGRRMEKLEKIKKIATLKSFKILQSL